MRLTEKQFSLLLWQLTESPLHLNNFRELFKLEISNLYYYGEHMNRFKSGTLKHGQ
jgi:hypothetical protein